MAQALIRRIGLGAIIAMVGETVGYSSAAPPTSSPNQASSGPGADKAAKVLEDIPGLDFTSLSPTAQKELAAVFTDEFCYCGCPHTLGACLKTHSSCKHARRMALLAASQAAAGTPSVEIVVTLSKYYLSFREPRKAFSPDPRMCTGSKDAKITLVEFSDFECPFCKAARPILETLTKENSAQMKFCYQPFPLPAHSHAIPAAEAALFARDQGKFWAMHDLLFENQTSLSVERIKQLAAKLGLNTSELTKAMESGKYTPEIAASQAAARASDLVSTPTVFINGRKFNLPFTHENLQHTLDDEREWIANRNAWAAD